MSTTATSIASDKHFVNTDTLRISHDEMRDPLNSNAARVKFFYATYSTMNEWCYISLDNIAKAVNLTPTQVKNARTQLIKAGQLESAYHSHSGEHVSCKYRRTRLEEAPTEWIDHLQSLYGALKFDGATPKAEKIAAAKKAAVAAPAAVGVEVEPAVKKISAKEGMDVVAKKAAPAKVQISTETVPANAVRLLLQRVSKKAENEVNKPRKDGAQRPAATLWVTAIEEITEAGVAKVGRRISEVAEITGRGADDVMSEVHDRLANRATYLRIYSVITRDSRGDKGSGFLCFELLKAVEKIVDEFLAKKSADEDAAEYADDNAKLASVGMPN
jgi:hypothetical protein